MRKLRRSILVICCIASVLSMQANSFAQEYTNNVVATKIESDSMEDIYKGELINELSGDDIEPLRVKKGKRTYTVNEKSIKVKIPKKLSEPIKINDMTSDVSLEIGVKKVNNKTSNNVIDDAIVFENEKISTGVEVFDGGVRQTFVLKDDTAPKQYELEYDAKGLSYINYAYDDEGQTDGSLLLYKENGDIIASIDPPWAKDKNGQNVNTYYIIKGTTVIQIVEPSKKNEYPIVADPKSWTSYYTSSKFIKRNKKWTLQIKPKITTRMSWSKAKAGWFYLRGKHSSSKYWKNTDGLYDQYKCHAYYAIFKPYWNIEPWRPNVSWNNTVKANCNPK